MLLEGTVSLVRRLGHEEARAGADGVAGAVGRRLPGLGPAGVYLATGRATSAGRMLRVPADRAARSRPTAGSRSASTSSEGLVGTVRNIESMARQREALVALGTLAAGFAHEINNPASAATRAAGALQDAGAALLSSLGRLADRRDLRRRSSPRSTRCGGRSTRRRASTAPLVVADREDALSDWLAAHGVERDWFIAPPLAAAGVDVAWCERAAAVLGGGAARGRRWSGWRAR